jgi:hypothetical protein
MKVLHPPLHLWWETKQAQEVQPCLIIEWDAMPIVVILSSPS